MPQVIEVNTNNYKPFDETYGSELDDSDRPGKDQTEKYQIQWADFQLQPCRARMIIRCVDCCIARLLYSNNKLDAGLFAVRCFRWTSWRSTFHLWPRCWIQKIYKHPKTFCYKTLGSQYYTRVRAQRSLGTRNNNCGTRNVSSYKIVWIGKSCATSHVLLP